MNSSPLDRGALHEAGRAVMARILGCSLGPIWINRLDSSGRTYARRSDEPEQELRKLLAARACQRSFGIETLHDQGGFGDEARIRTLMDEMRPDDDEDAKARYLHGVDIKLAALFGRPHVRAAARALAEILTREGEIDGMQAEALIDQHLGSAAAREG